MLVLRSLFFTIVIPGTVVVLIPYLVVSRGGGRVPETWTTLHYLSLIPILVGAVVLFWCIRDFASKGQGTLAPIDPPRQLVVEGLYHYVRNPMYLGALLLLLGEALFFRATELLVYALAWFFLINLIVLLREEPLLRKRFGESYDRYRRSVHRWLPTRPTRRD